MYGVCQYQENNNHKGHEVVSTASIPRARRPFALPSRVADARLVDLGAAVRELGMGSKAQGCISACWLQGITPGSVEIFTRWCKHLGRVGPPKRQAARLATTSHHQVSCCMDTWMFLMRVQAGRGIARHRGRSSKAWIGVEGGQGQAEHQMTASQRSCTNMLV